MKWTIPARGTLALFLPTQGDIRQPSVGRLGGSSPVTGREPNMLTQVKNLIVKLKPLYPRAAVLKKVGLVAVLLAAIGAAFFLGRQGALSDCQAQTPASSIPEPNLSPVSATDYGQRVVAYIYGNVPITRE